MKNKIISHIANVLRLFRGEVSTSKLIKRGLKVGKRFSRQGGVRIDYSFCYLIQIGDDVTLAPNVNILAHDASLTKILGVQQIGKVLIGNNVFIGASSIIHSNVTIGDNVIIGAQSNVTKSIPSNSVAFGNPARVVSTIEDFRNKKAAMVQSNPVFDRDYNSFDISPSAKKHMNKELSSNIGFVKCENFEKIINK